MGHLPLLLMGHKPDTQPAHRENSPPVLNSMEVVTMSLVEAIYTGIAPLLEHDSVVPVVGEENLGHQSLMEGNWRAEMTLERRLLISEKWW